MAAASHSSIRWKGALVRGEQQTDMRPWGFVYMSYVFGGGLQPPENGGKSYMCLKRETKRERVCVCVKARGQGKQRSLSWQNLQITVTRKQNMVASRFDVRLCVPQGVTL